MDYETGKVTLAMNAVEFEAVFDFLQHCVYMIDEAIERGVEVPEADRDRRDTIRTLKFTFEDGHSHKVQ